MRPSGRNLDEIRSITIETNVTKHAEGSALLKLEIPTCYVLRR